MLVTDQNSEKRLGFLFFAYAPTSYAFEHVKPEFEDAFENAMYRRNIGNVFVIYAGANTSLDRNDLKRTNVDAHASIGQHMVLIASMMHRGSDYALFSS